MTMKHPLMMNIVHEASSEDWENIAVNLSRSADVLWNAFVNESRAITANMHADVTESPASYVHTPAIMLVWGLALEAIAKAILTKRESHSSGRARASLPPQITRGHAVDTLLEVAGVPLTNSEREFGQRLTVFVAWAGRYPYPKPAQPLGLRIIQPWEQAMFQLLLDKARHVLSTG
jgi:hypothetical protein